LKLCLFILDFVLLCFFLMLTDEEIDSDSELDEYMEQQIGMFTFFTKLLLCGSHIYMCISYEI